MNGRNVRVGACLLAGDMDRMAPFYRDVLGLSTQWEDGNFAEFETANGGNDAIHKSTDRLLRTGL